MRGTLVGSDRRRTLLGLARRSRGPVLESEKNNEKNEDHLESEGPGGAKSGREERAEGARLCGVCPRDVDRVRNHSPESEGDENGSKAHRTHYTDGDEEGRRGDGSDEKENPGGEESAPTFDQALSRGGDIRDVAARKVEA